ncbi:efflux RND transporter periplasmic adaptor subunit [Puniceicoccus vermicola]|uniref:Biotin/lipoyl-binding protein n=1 Tax=Puniceicoccus vermicola TaxID=388746 RepID=A0A7X1E4S3_9BACT|nr:biotin/lipoyl-binding protein [Puniceicoccus vermicola]MBC2602436.1 biotin/lipoyl-binding protein [Puniceicoccus vermicola]
MTDPLKNDTSDLAERIDSEKKKHDRSRKYIYLVGGILLVVAIVWLSPIGSKSEDDGLPKFVTQSLDRGEIRKTITATGSLAPTNEVTVGSELSGTTMEVYVDSNDEVEEGQPLALLDTTALKNQLKANKANLASARASVKQAEATVAEAESSLARQKEWFIVDWRERSSKEAESKLTDVVTTLTSITSKPLQHEVCTMFPVLGRLHFV